MIERVKDLGILDKVHFTGWRSDAEYLASAFDIYVCPSIIEGMSNSLLEAMARSLPVVATAVGGNVENVVEGKTGFLVPPNDPESMADAILRLLTNRAMAAEMGLAGKERLEKVYSARLMVHQMESLYRHLLANRKPPKERELVL
jgi:glycosyltransferase involved in cell wall biosynthesis